MKRKKIHIYLQIPFCRQRCPFCYFTDLFDVKDLTNLELIDTYLDVLIKEISDFDMFHYLVTDISIGGGTPTILSNNRLQKLIQTAKNKFNNGSRDNLFISIETTPELCSYEKLNFLKKLDIKRLSIGVQTFSNHLLKFLGRKYNYKEIIQSVELARKVGFDEINIDLLFGFPGQTLETWKETIDNTIKLDVEHISTNNLLIAYEGYNKLQQSAQKLNYKIPDDELRKSMFEYAINTLIENRYNQYMFFNFAKSGYQNEYEMDVFTFADNIISFGPGTNTCINEQLILSKYDIRGYIKNPKSIRNSFQNSKRNFVRLNLFLKTGVDKRVFNERFNFDLENFIKEDKYCSELIAELKNKEILLFTKDGFKIQPHKITEGMIFLYKFHDKWIEKRNFGVSKCNQ